MKLPSDTPNETLGDARLYGDDGGAGMEGLALGCAVNSAGTTGCSQAGVGLDCLCTREETALLLSEDWGERVTARQVKCMETRLLRYLRRKLLPFARDMRLESARNTASEPKPRQDGDKRNRFKEARRLKRQQREQKGRAGE